MCTILFHHVAEGIKSKDFHLLALEDPYLTPSTLKFLKEIGSPLDCTAQSKLLKGLFWLKIVFPKLMNPNPLEAPLPTGVSGLITHSPLASLLPKPKTISLLLALL